MPQVVTERQAAVDVLVVGGGIAATTAALTAAEEGAQVALACSGDLFGGSSFFAGTWGLGLVGPGEGAGELADFEREVLEVGRGMASPELVRTLLAGVEPAREWLEGLGCELLRPDDEGQREYIPCFDRKTRSWTGLSRASYRAALGAALEHAGVRICRGFELLDLSRAAGGFTAALYASESNALVSIPAGSVILATGGFGGLFDRTLTDPSVLAAGQAVALELGASLVNCEFIQIMPGLVSPARDVVFNEKTFRFARIDGVAPGLLAQRAEHGPFTASRPDREVDFAIARSGADGARVSYEMPAELPEFMQTYANWLEETYGIGPDDDLCVAHYAHASNGGILVDSRAQVVGVEGLFACGECAGGMHGADRIGGLASANALVFGRIAGHEAAARGMAGREAVARGAADATFPAACSGLALPALAALRRAMGEHCLVERDEQGLLECLDTIGELRTNLRAATVAGTATSDSAGIAATRRAELALTSAEAMVSAMLARTESRGAHFRADHPGQDPAQTRPLAVSQNEEGQLVAAPLTN